MSAIGRAGQWMRALVARGAMEREMHEEMQAHLAQAAERLRARGMSERDAWHAARREFGSVGVVQEYARDARGGRWADALAGDLRYAARYFARSPLLALTIMLTLALGIGTNAALLTILDGITARPAPGVPADASVVFVHGTMRFGTRNRLTPRSLSFREVADYRNLPAFQDVAAWTGDDMIVATGPDESSTGVAFGDFVTPNYFDVAGIRLLHGSGFVDKTFSGADTPEMSVVIGHAFWMEKYGGAADIVGRRMRVNDREATIVGVAPARFNGVERSSTRLKIWMPISALSVFDPERRVDPSGYTRGRLSAIGRLKAGVTLEEAAPAIRLTAANAAAQLPPDRNMRDLSAVPFPTSRNLEMESDPEELIIGGALFGSIGILILLICCTNVSSLLIGAAVRRRHEIAVRLSMGASRGRVVRQLLTEVALLAVGGGAVGLALYWMITANTGHLLRDVDITADWKSAGAAAAVALATTLICGLAPALHATRIQLASVLKDSASTGSSRSKLQRTFVVAQMALTQPLLVALAVLVAILVGEIEHGPRATGGERILRANFNSWVAGAPASRAGNDDRLRELRARIEALPGVVGTVAQPNGVTETDLVAVAARAARPFRARLEGMSPGHFGLLGIPLVRGREFEANDTQLNETPVIVDTEFANELWGPTDPLGKRFRQAAARSPSQYVVVGVVDANDVGFGSATDKRRLFVPNKYGWSGTLLIRTRGPAETIVPTIRAIGMAQTPRIPLIGAKTLAQVDRDKRMHMLQAMGATALGGMLALFLGAIGLYALVALGVGQRVKEIGIRISVGARPRDVVAMFFGHGLRLGALGMAIGLPLSLAAAWVFASQLGLPRVNLPLVAVSVAASATLVASLASWLPARRAASVDPLVALRAE